MTQERFILLGHSNPLGGYPAPVVPVGHLNERLVAVYAAEDGPDVVSVAQDCSYVIHDADQQVALDGFDHRRHRLFALSEKNILSYLSEHEKEFFHSLLDNPRFAHDNPFLRLSLAKATKEASAIADELSLCARAIARRTPHYLGTWIDEEKETVVGDIESGEASSVLTLLESLRATSAGTRHPRDVEETASMKEVPFELVSNASQLTGAPLTAKMPGDSLSDRVRLLILKAWEHGRKGRFDEVLKLSEEALSLDQNAWQAALTKGAALAQLGRLHDAERVFLDILAAFAGNNRAVASAYQNLGWLEEVRSAGSLDVKSLKQQVKYYEQALALDHSMLRARASLVQCKVMLGELSDASALLTQSLSYPGFLKAFRHETKHRGRRGHQIVRQLPEWFYLLLFPKREVNQDDQ